jgi:hypothetical protein
MIVMQVNMKRPDDLEAFMDSLTGTGAFYDLLPGEMQRNRGRLVHRHVVGRLQRPVDEVAVQSPVRKGGPQP